MIGSMIFNQRISETFNESAYEFLPLDGYCLKLNIIFIPSKDRLVILHIFKRCI